MKRISRPLIITGLGLILLITDYLGTFPTSSLMKNIIAEIDMIIVITYLVIFGTIKVIIEKQKK